jgi:hypothetical protein
VRTARGSALWLIALALMVPSTVALIWRCVNLTRKLRNCGGVAPANSGHATEQIQQHYSTVVQTERRQGIDKIISLAGVRKAMSSGGMEVVRIDPKNENGQSGSDSQLADSA